MSTVFIINEKIQIITYEKLHASKDRGINVSCMTMKFPCMELKCPCIKLKFTCMEILLNARKYYIFMHENVTFMPRFLHA